MKSKETTTPEKNSLFGETRVSKDFKTTLTPGTLKSSAQISREKPTDQEWFQVWGNSIDDLEEMAIVKIPVGQREEDYIIRGTKKFKDALDIKGIQVELVDDILKYVWQKFIYICAKLVRMS